MTKRVTQGPLSPASPPPPPSFLHMILRCFDAIAGQHLRQERAVQARGLWSGHPCARSFGRGCLGGRLPLHVEGALERRPLQPHQGLYARNAALASCMWVLVILLRSIIFLQPGTYDSSDCCVRPIACVYCTCCTGMHRRRFACRSVCRL